MKKMQNILLIITGGVAAYKALDLIRRLRDEGYGVTPVLTQGAQQFITPLSAASLAGTKAYTDLFSLNDEAEMGHIQLSRASDLVLVAPATANAMAKLAQGLADDLASTLLLATDKPVMMAPAMNVRMWEHPATRRNVKILADDGVRMIGPVEGPMACGEYGPGRMAEVADIVAAVKTYFLARQGGPLFGRRAIVTAGPTFEAIDPVRFIGNRSSGRQGFAIAEALRDAGADCLLVAGPVDLPDPWGVTVKRVEDARAMLAAVEASLPADIAIMTAAVSDWRTPETQPQKIKKNGQAPVLTLVENPDILAHVARHPTARPGLVIGFAAETENLIDNAQAKRAKKGCDWIIANDVGRNPEIFQGARNHPIFITPEKAEDWGWMEKRELASRLTDRIARHVNGGAP